MKSCWGKGRTADLASRFARGAGRLTFSGPAWGTARCASAEPGGRTRGERATPTRPAGCPHGLPERKAGVTGTGRRSSCAGQRGCAKRLAPRRGRAPSRRGRGAAPERDGAAPRPLPPSREARRRRACAALRAPPLGRPVTAGCRASARDDGPVGAGDGEKKGRPPSASAVARTTPGRRNRSRCGQRCANGWAPCRAASGGRRGIGTMRMRRIRGMRRWIPVRSTRRGDAVRCGRSEPRSPRADRCSMGARAFVSSGARTSRLSGWGGCGGDDVRRSRRRCRSSVK